MIQEYLTTATDMQEAMSSILRFWLTTSLIAVPIAEPIAEPIGAPIGAVIVTKVQRHTLKKANI